MKNADSRVREICERRREQFLEIFRHCHMYPEVAMEEFETTRYITEMLEGLGLEIKDIGLETGVVALLRGRNEDHCVALRADIDALPVEEQSSCPFPSRNKGKMHACGHDTHYGALLCAAIVLSELKDELDGCVKFIFQPAEEINNGAIRMIPAGCLQDPQVEAIYSYHNSPEIPTGTVAVIPGPIMASVDDLIITVRGKGGHGGIPHRNVDPVVAAAAVIQALQTVISRNVSPVDSGVISICSVHAGGDRIQNVIPDEVRMYGTIRAYKEETEYMMHRRVREICEGIGTAYGVDVDTEIIHHLSVTDNRPVDGHKDLYDLAYRSAVGAGAQPVRPDPSGGGDDFSQYMTGVKGYEGVPGFFYWLGVRNEEKDCCYSWHSPKYQADTDAVPIGAALFALSAINTLDELSEE